MYANEYPDLSTSDLNGPCPKGGWPTFGLHATTHGYDAAAHVGPVSVKWVSQGAEVYVVDGVPLTITPDRLLLLADGQEYESHVPHGAEATSLCAFFAPRFVANHVDPLSRSIEHTLENPELECVQAFEVMPQIVDKNSALAIRMKRLRVAIDDNADTLRMEEELVAVLNEVYALQQRTEQSTDRVPARKRSTRREVFRRLLIAMAYMDGNCTRSLSLADIAAVAWMSPYHFLRTFRQVTGQTPFQYVCARRIERAKDLLSAANEPIVEVAEAVGYDSHTSFHAAFRRHTGETPDHYRRRTIRNLEERMRP